MPAGLTVQTFDGTGWVGVVPFRMTGVSLRPLPDLPWISAFPELNVRTYVERDGKPGVWFFSLDAANPLAVWAARKFFHLPYFEARMSVEEADGWVRYDSVRLGQGKAAAAPAGSETTTAGEAPPPRDRPSGPSRRPTPAGESAPSGEGSTRGKPSSRREPSPSGEPSTRGEPPSSDEPPSFRARYRPVSAPREAEAGTLEHWLTERYCLYARSPSGRLFRTEVHHRPWLLQPARAEIHRNGLCGPHGFRCPGEPVLLHFSRRIDVVVWSPEEVGGGPA